jgi:hypothetical protein
VATPVAPKQADHLCKPGVCISQAGIPISLVIFEHSLPHAPSQRRSSLAHRPSTPHPPLSIWCCPSAPKQLTHPDVPLKAKEHRDHCEYLAKLPNCFFLFQRQYATPPMSITPAIEPTIMPAMAPPLSPPPQLHQSYCALFALAPICVL